MRGWRVFFFFSFLSNAVEFIGGISWLHGDVGTVLIFSPYLCVYLVLICVFFKYKYRPVKSLPNSKGPFAVNRDS